MTEAERAVFSDPWSASAIRAQLLSPLAVSLILESAGQPQGYLLASSIPPEGELYRIAVLPTARGLGFGRILLSSYIEEENKRGCDRLFLEVRESNSAAIRLYESLGYQKAVTRRRYYKNPTEDAVLYVLRKDTTC